MKEIKLKKQFECSCGRIHRAPLEKAVVGSGAIEYVKQAAEAFNAKTVFVLADANTFKAAGEKVCAVLKRSGVNCSVYVYEQARVIPDDCAVGKAVMALDNTADMVIGVGSGVINDIGKIVATTAKLPYAIVGTAPSMDGYASATSSMEIGGFKVSVNSKIPEIIIGDTDVLKNAPLKSIAAGLGDMLAKYVSIADWKISSLINDEYFCEEIAEMVRGALKKCVDNVSGLLKRDHAAAEAVFEGLLISGAAMSYAGLSRPASGAEHYVSHIYDMRGLAFGTPVDTHGTQCGIGTLVSARVYDKLKRLRPDREKALNYVKSFDKAAWYEKLRAYVGPSAETMIKIDEEKGRYDADLHAKRLDRIIGRWDEILAVANAEMPSAAYVESALSAVNAPLKPEDIGLSSADLPVTFAATKDVRDKYVLSNLCFDLGVLDEII